MEIKDMTIEQIEARKAEIAAEVEAATTIEEVTERTKERDALNAELEERKKLEQAKAEARAAVAAGAGKTIEKKEETKMEEKRTYSVESPEYRTGFLKDMLGMELTAEERQAVDFVATTTDASYGSGNVLPHTMLEKIWDLIEEQHSILGDVTMYRTGTVIEVNKRTEITQGDAKSVNENAANDDEINTFVKVTLAGKDFSKHVNISYAMAKMSVGSFEQFLTNEIADRIGSALSADCVAQILTDYDDDNNAVTTANVGSVVWTDVTSVFSVLKGAKNKVVYATEQNIYKYLAGMVDSNGRPIFQPTAQAGVAGYLLGAPVKVEDAVTAVNFLVGDASNVVYNMVQDIMVESDRDIKKHVITYSGYARGEGALIKPKSFATLAVKSQD